MHTLIRTLKLEEHIHLLKMVESLNTKLVPKIFLSFTFSDQIIKAILGKKIIAIMYASGSILLKIKCNVSSLRTTGIQNASTNVDMIYSFNPIHDKNHIPMYCGCDPTRFTHPRVVLCTTPT